MRTIGDLLSFYGVEIGKRYKMTRSNLTLSGTQIFTVEKTTDYCGGLGLRFEDSYKTCSIAMLNECCYEEIKPASVLDDVERKYLQHYIMDNPAFQGKVMEIAKFAEIDNERGFLVIYLLDGDLEGLPYFSLDMMYKGMELEKHYSVQELGLKR